MDSKFEKNVIYLTINMIFYEYSAPRMLSKALIQMTGGLPNIANNQF